jgi:hypothetical protein
MGKEKELALSAFSACVVFARDAVALNRYD